LYSHPTLTGCFSHAGGGSALVNFLDLHALQHPASVVAYACPTANSDPGWPGISPIGTLCTRMLGRRTPECLPPPSRSLLAAFSMHTVSYYFILHHYSTGTRDPDHQLPTISLWESRRSRQSTSDSPPRVSATPSIRQHELGIPTIGSGCRYL